MCRKISIWKNGSVLFLWRDSQEGSSYEGHVTSRNFGSSRNMRRASRGCRHYAAYFMAFYGEIERERKLQCRRQVNDNLFPHHSIHHGTGTSSWQPDETRTSHNRYYFELWTLWILEFSNTRFLPPGFLTNIWDFWTEVWIGEQTYIEWFSRLYPDDKTHPTQSIPTSSTASPGWHNQKLRLDIGN